MRNSIISLSFILIDFPCTDKLTIPIVVPAPVSDIRSTTALCGGTVVSGGGDNLMKQGICWSVEKNPTISYDYVYDSVGLSSFSITISWLSIAAFLNHIRLSYKFILKRIFKTKSK